jgi:arginyl-tRNA synthetase
LEVVNNEILDKSDKLDGKEREAIAISALKFSILRAGLGKNINFDPETSLSFEGDSGPYLQYSAVRAKAILAKAKEMGKSISVDSSASATELTKNISRFQDCVEQSISKWEPHYIATYLLSIAQSFNSWYATGKILDENNKNMDHELALVSGTYNVLLKGLNLLGISVPEKM